MKEDMTFTDRIKLLAGSLVIVAAVYLGVKYLFPITAPFIIAYLIAMVIDKPVCRLAKCIGGRRTLAAVIVVLLISVIMLVGTGYVIYLGIGEIRSFVQNYDYYVIYIQHSAAGICSNIDGWLGCVEGSCFRLVCDVASKVSAVFTGDSDAQMVGRVVSLSVPAVTNIIKIAGSVVICVISVIYASSGRDSIHKWCANSVYRREIFLLRRSLKRLINVYFRIQLIIMAVNSTVCVIGLLIMGNPYACVIGIIIGVVDALPIFGSGTILLPWSLFMLMSKDVFGAAVLVTLYVITYFVREILESKCMGDRLGIAPFTMLVVIFVGLMIYGIMGFILGPVSYCIIKELIVYLKTSIKRGKLHLLRK